MDKQMIEEMEKDLKTAGLFAMDWLCAETKQIVKEQGWFNSVNHTKSMYEIMAEELIKKNYCKIPEDAVVLTGMETEQRFEDLMVAFDEMGFMPNTTHPFPEEYVETWKQRLIFVFGQLRKETAEKFAERLKAKAELMPTPARYVDMVYVEDIDEILKEITEGK